MSSKDFQLQVKVRNGKVARLMEEHGIPTVAELSRQTGMRQATLGGIVNLKSEPWKKRVGRGGGTGVYEGTYKRAYELLSLFFGVDVMDLWPDELGGPLQRNMGEAYFDLADIPELLPYGYREIPMPDELVDEQLTRDLVEKAITAQVELSEWGRGGSLTKEEGTILRGRLLEGKTLDEVGAEVGGTRERVRQKESKGLRKMRHPNKPYFKALKEAWK